MGLFGHPTQDPTKPVPESAKFAVFSLILVLTLTLYVIDRVHQVWLQATVERARDLERLLGYQLTTLLSDRVKNKQAIGLGVGLYAVLMVATYFAFFVSIGAPLFDTSRAWLRDVYQVAMIAEFIIGVLVIEALVVKDLTLRN